MFMIRSLNHAQLCRFTLWIENRHRFSSSTTTFLHFPFMQLRHSSNQHSKTPKIPLLSNHKNYEKKIKERAKIHKMVRKNWKDVEILTCRSSAGSCGVCDVYLVGTTHDSQESCEEVKKIIQILRPEVVFLELCSCRKNVLSRENMEPPTVGEMIAGSMKKPNILAALVCWLYAKEARKLKVIPESEFCVAYEEAIKYGGEVVLGDRCSQITMKRAWRNMALWEKTIILFSFLLHPMVSKLKKKGYHTDMLDFQLPCFEKTIGHERDQYMSFALFKRASDSRSVVAVVGEAHLQGIKKHWKQPIVLEELLTIPPQKAISLTSVVVAGVAIISCIYLS